MTTPSNRLYFLDWIRILAFLLLIVYHVGMYYVSWDWIVKSPHANDAIEPLMMLSSPWRLGLLFLVSGVASSFMLAKMSAGRFVRMRSARLLVPLLFAMLVIVPFQPYFEVIEKVGYKGSYLDFMRLYVTGYGGFCRATDCLLLPTWNHLWFVAYLAAYTLVFGAIVRLLGARFDALARRCGQCLAGWRVIVLPAAVFGLLRLSLQPYFETTHALVDDWYNNAHYFTLFILGAFMARVPAVWARFSQVRWQALGVALTCWGVMVVYYSLPEASLSHPELGYALMRLVYALCAWCAIVAICGFACLRLNWDHPARAWLTQAVFPVYIFHQSLIVSMAHLMKPATLHPAVEALVLIVLTLCISFGLFEMVRRVAILRPLFGIDRDRIATSPPQRAADGLAA